MSVKPTTSMLCNTHACQQTYSTANGGWGAVSSATFNLSIKPKSLIINGNCDDWAIVWVNGVVVYNPGGCSCGGSCCNNFTINGVNQTKIGTNTVQYQCNDRCGGSSGGSIVITVNY